MASNAVGRCWLPAQPDAAPPAYHLLGPGAADLYALDGVFRRHDLQLLWGSPFLLFAVSAVMELSADRVAWPRVRQTSALKLFALIRVGLLLLGQFHAAVERRWLHAQLAESQSA